MKSPRHFLTVSLLTLVGLTAAAPAHANPQARTASKGKPHASAPVAANAGKNITFAFAGDIMQGTTFPEDGTSYLPADNGKMLFNDVTDVLSQADVAAANNEGTLLDGAGTVKRCGDPNLCYAFRTPTSYVDNLVAAGIDFMSVANNHVNDFGPEGVRSTESTLRKAGIAFAGLRDRCETAIIERNGKKIGFAAFGHNKGTLSIMDMDEVDRVVKGLKQQADIVVVSFHGGGEGSKFSHVPDGMEKCFGEDRGDLRKFTHRAVDAGADVVYGHGPHVTRGVELYGDRLILYSLGNFVTPYRVNLKGINGYAPVVTVTVDPEGRFVSGRIHSFIQQRGIGPRKDTTNSVAVHMAQLSREDFPTSPLKITNDGQISRK